MKRYVPIIIGIVALCAVLYAGNVLVDGRTDAENEEQTSSTALTTYEGKVTRVFEGENTLEYMFDLMETATTTVDMNGARVRVTDEAGMPVVAIYFSYEGGRGYSPTDYITNVIAPKVPGLSAISTSTMGLYEWSVVESSRSIWHVAATGNGNWLAVIENTKEGAEMADPIIESLNTK